jgi:hypothetical protein
MLELILEINKEQVMFSCIRKAIYIIAGIVLMATLLASTRASSDTIDPIMSPINKVELQKEILSVVAEKDQEKLYAILVRARLSRLSEDAAALLDGLMPSHKQDPFMLAARPMAHAFALGIFGGPLYETDLMGWGSNYETEYLRAEKMNPKLWIAFVTEAQISLRFKTEFKDLYKDKKAFNLINKAIEIAPNCAFTHDILAEYYVYASASIWNADPKLRVQYLQKDIEESNTALKLKPNDSRAAARLLGTYTAWLRDKEKAKAAKSLYLSMVPPGFKFNAESQKRLDEIK